MIERGKGWEGKRWNLSAELGAIFHRVWLISPRREDVQPLFPGLEHLLPVLYCISALASHVSSSVWWKCCFARWEGGCEAAPSVVGRRERSERLMWRFIAVAVTTTEGGSLSSSLLLSYFLFPAPPKGEEGNHPRRCAALCGRKREGRSFCVTTPLPLLFPSLCSMTF